MSGGLFEGITERFLGWVMKWLVEIAIIIILILAAVFFLPQLFRPHSTVPGKKPGESSRVNVVVNPSPAIRKKADQNIRVKTRVIIPGNKSKEGEKGADPPAKVEREVEDQNGWIISQNSDSVEIKKNEDGSLVIETASDFAIIVKDSPLKVILSYDQEGLYPGIGFRAFKTDFWGLENDFDILINVKPEFGLGLSGEVEKFDWGSLWIGAGGVYDPGPEFMDGKFRWLFYGGLSF